MLSSVYFSISYSLLRRNLKCTVASCCPGLIVNAVFRLCLVIIVAFIKNQKFTEDILCLVTYCSYHVTFMQSERGGRGSVMLLPIDDVSVNGQVPLPLDNVCVNGVVSGKAIKGLDFL